MSILKVNGQIIFDVKTIKHVLVEKTIKGLSGPTAVPIYHDFDYDKFIGVAEILWGESKRKGIIKVNIYLLADVKGFPAIGYTDADKKIYCVSIGAKRNKDSDIKPIL